MGLFAFTLSKLSGKCPKEPRKVGSAIVVLCRKED